MFQKENKCQVHFTLQFDQNVFTNIKDKIAPLGQSSIIYKFTCPSCSSSYIGKTEITLYERREGHAYYNKNSKDQSAVYKHISSFPNYNHILDILTILKLNSLQIRNSATILDRTDN